MGAQHSCSNSPLYVQLTGCSSLGYIRLTICHRCGAPRCPLMDWVWSKDIITLGVCESISHTIFLFFKLLSQAHVDTMKKKAYVTFQTQSNLDFHDLIAVQASRNWQIWSRWSRITNEISNENQEPPVLRGCQNVGNRKEV